MRKPFPKDVRSFSFQKLDHLSGSGDDHSKGISNLSGMTIPYHTYIYIYIPYSHIYMCGFWSSPFHGYAERGPEQSSRKFFTPLSAVSNKAVKNIRDDKGLKLVLVICSQKVSSTFTLLFFEGRTGSPTAPLLAFRSTRVAPGSDMGCGGSAQGARVHDLDAFADVSPSNSEVLAKPVPRLEHMRAMELRVISACNGWNWLAPCVNRPHFLLELNSHCRSQDSQSYWFTRTSLTKKHAQSCQNPR